MKVMKNSKNKIPYDERTDDEKLVSNWKKATALFGRKDYSAAVIRVATSTEIATNIYIRHYLQEEHQLPEEFVNSLLFSANGISGKFKKLVMPASTCRGSWDEVKKIQKKIESINRQRNEVAHSGKFKNKKDTKSVFKNSLEVILTLAPAAAGSLSLPFES